MNYGDIRGPLEAILAHLKKIERNTRCLVCGSSLASIAGTQAGGDPLSIIAGYTSLRVTKTNGSGTVTITFPDASTYDLTADGEVFEISGSPLGEFSISTAGGATYKYVAY
jgi:hypothetical protein